MNNTILLEQLKMIIEWIKFSDTKSAFTSTVYLAISWWMYTVKDSVWNEWLFWKIIFILAIIIIFLGFTFIVLSILPNRKNKLSDESVLYYESISLMELDNFSDDLSQLIKEEVNLNSELVKQIYVNSKIATRKMKFIELSLLLLSFLVYLFLIFIAFK